jgi:hypothetical protein
MQPEQNDNNATGMVRFPIGVSGLAWVNGQATYRLLATQVNGIPPVHPVW